MQRFESEAYRAVIDADPDPRRCRIQSVAMEQMRKHARLCYPHEACGLLIGHLNEQGWTVEEARGVANLNQERANDRFELDPRAYRRIDDELRGGEHEIIGIFHSHPDCPARPSPTDLSHAWDAFLYPIVAIGKTTVDEIAFWALNEQGNAFRRISHICD